MMRQPALLQLLCYAVPCCAVQSPAFHNFTRMLVKVAEHTW